MKRQGILLAAAVLVVVLAGVGGWFWPMPAPTGAVNTHQPKWLLPTTGNLERSTAAQFAAASGVAWLGDSGLDGATPGAQWTLLGVVGRPDDRAILIQSGADPLIKRLHAGDTLPDGSKLVAVGRSGFVMERDGCRTERPLYPSANTKPPAQTAGEACSPPGTD